MPFLLNRSQARSGRLGSRFRYVGIVAVLNSSRSISIACLALLYSRIGNRSMDSGICNLVYCKKSSSVVGIFDWVLSVSSKGMSIYSSRILRK